MKSTFYDMTRIEEKHARYNLIFGERSNGKTFAILLHAFKIYLKDGSQLGLIRRMEEDFVGQNSAKTCYDSLMCDGNGVNQIEKLSHGKYNGVQYFNKRFYLTIAGDDGKSERTDECIAYAFALSSMEHYKSASFPKIKTIFYDEFITRRVYLVDEFMLFQNMLSTIIRQRDDVTIWMAGNTVAMYGCPYFTEMGLSHVKDMKQGEIEVYTYGDSDLRVAVEYTEPGAKAKKSDVYFAFNNPKLNMIKSGQWEMDIYPHCPVKYRPMDIRYVYFIVWEGITCQCEIVYTDDAQFTFIHVKTTPIKDDNTNIVYTKEFNPAPHYRRKITKPTNPLEKRIAWFYATDKVYYQNNEIGELIRNYLQWCGKTV